MTTREQAFHDAILRTNFDWFLRRCLMTLNPGSPYLPNGIFCDRPSTSRIRRGEITRLIINMPPRHLKSLTVSVAFSAFLLGLGPWRRIFAISYSNELSRSMPATSALLSSPVVSTSIPDMQIARSLDDEVLTTARGFRKSTSVYGTLTGLAGDISLSTIRRSRLTPNRTPTQPTQSMGLEHADVSTRQQGNGRDHRRYATRAPR